MLVLNEQNNDEQATDLQKLIEEVHQNANIQHEAPGESTSEESNQIRKIDILNLPPRKKIHSNQKKRLHIKLSRPLFRLLSVIIILLVIIYGAFFIWGNELIT